MRPRLPFRQPKEVLPERIPELVQEMAKKKGCPPGEVALYTMISLLRELINVTIEAPKVEGSGPPGAIIMVEVIIPGTPVQAPSSYVPRGHEVVVRMRHHSTSTERLGYVGFSEQQVSRTNYRSEWKSNDSFIFPLEDTDVLWFDSDTANTRFEIITVQYSQNPLLPRASSQLF